MTKTYELANERMIMADVDEKHHTATVSVFALDDLVKEVNKTGHWIRVTDKTGHLVWECDECGWQQRFNTNFCPDCGVKMVEPQKSEG